MQVIVIISLLYMTVSKCEKPCQIPGGGGGYYMILSNKTIWFLNIAITLLGQIFVNFVEQYCDQSSDASNFISYCQQT